MSISPNFYESLATELKSKFKRVNNFTKHPGSVGTYHEEALKSILRQFLPKRFSLKTGFIFGGENNVSKQIDILIIDESEPTSYFLQEGEFVIVQPEAVVCAIEVKTKFNDMNSVIENLAEVNRVAETTDRKHIIPTFLFAFDGIEYKPEKLSKMFSLCHEVELNHYPIALYAFNKFFLQYMAENETKNIKRGYHAVRMFNISRTQENLLHLSMFLMSIRKCCESHAGKKSNPFDHSLVSYYNGITIENDYYLFGKKMIKS